MARLDRAVILQSILERVDFNKSSDPDFGLVPPEWQLSNIVPDQPTDTKRVLHDCQENQKPLLSLSLKKRTVRILDSYLKKLPPGSTAFYKQPVLKPDMDSAKPWFQKCEPP